MEKNILLYFRAVADEDNDDNNGAETSVAFNASYLKGMVPHDDNNLSLFFDSLRNIEGADDQADEVTISDEVRLTLSSANTHEDVIKELVRSINGEIRNPKNDGVIVVVDAVTTNVAGETVSATFITGVSGCSIHTAAVHTGS